MLVGGYPCQPFSVAGKRLGTSDERGDLFLELARLLQVKKPRYFVFENVPGLLENAQGTAFAKILTTLSELGYCVAWSVLNSADFGIAQERKRVYLVGFPGNRCPIKVLAFGRANGENCATKAINTAEIPLMTAMDMNPPPNFTENARCITARQDIGISHHKGEHSCVFLDMSDAPKITENARCLNTRMDLGITNGQHKSERSGVLVEDAPRAIINPFKETVYQNGRRIKGSNEEMFTITVADRHGIVHRGRIRRLMPIECWRLQGFTREQFQKAAATGLSDAQLYKQTGTAVTVNMIEAVARNMKRFDEEMGATICQTM